MSTSKGRQRDRLRCFPHSRLTRTRHANSPISSSNTEAPNDLPYTLGLYQSSNSDREKVTSGPQHYSRRRRRPRQLGPSSSRKNKHPRPSSTSSSASTSTERECSSEFSTDSSTGRRHTHPKRKHRRQTSRLSSLEKSKLKRLSVPCCPNWQDFSKQASKQPRTETLTSLASCLEAWNQFAGVIVATKSA